MTVPVIAFFNNKGGVGKTWLTYHLAWMFADLGTRVLAADLDPQANLTSVFLEDARLEALWADDPARAGTIYGALHPLIRGVGDIVGQPHVERIDEDVHLVVGDLALARFEDELSQQWPHCLARQERAFRVISAFWRVIERAATATAAQVVLVDLGPNLGAINRAALIASDYLVVPLAPDLFSLQGLRNLGPTLAEWRRDWKDRHARNPSPDLVIPRGEMRPVGYVVMQHAVRLDRPARAFERWIARIPAVYSEFVERSQIPGIERYDRDPNCLGLVKHYRSLMPLAHEARKPMFHLKPADGAIGAHLASAEEARRDFFALASKIAERCAVPLAPTSN